MGMTLEQSPFGPRSYKTQSISSVLDAGVMLNVKVPLLAAVHLYQAALDSIEIQLPAVSTLLLPAPVMFDSEIVSLLQRRLAVAQSCPGLIAGV
ncbi:hypothetical protein D3C72_1255410 [compost metagenome]